MSDLSRIWDGDRPIIGASNALFRYQICCSVSKLWRLGSKIEAKFRTFNPRPVKVKGVRD